MSIVSALNPGTFVVDGAYIYESPASPGVPLGQNTSLLAIVGTATDGPLNTPTVFSNAGSLFAAFGAGTQLAHGLVREALSAMPEGTQFVASRVSDGTDVAAHINIVDTAPANVLVLTAKRTGSNANGATALVTLQSGTAAASPIYRITITYPYRNQEVFSGIIGYGTIGGPYVAATFQANAIAAINGTAPNSVASANVVAAAGASIIAPVVGTVFAGSGGLDGASGVVTANLVGVDGTTGRTGIYALRATHFAQLMVAGLTDLTVAQTLAGFVQQEGAIALIALGASGTSSDTAVASKNTNAAASRFLVTVMDWDYVYDAVSGQTLLVSPIGKIAGIISSLDPWQDPSNKPYGGAVGVTATERTAGQPISAAEAGERQGNGILYLTNPIPRGSVFGLPHGQASDGSNIADTRMLNNVAVGIQQILGNFVGELQSPAPNDQTRAQAQAALNAYLNSLLRPTQQIAAFQVIMDTSNNTPTTVAQGFLMATVLVQTLAGVKFALAALQVGSTVQIQTTAA